MQEQACRFGRAHHLVGIAGLPDTPAEHGVVGVVVLNAGLVHRVGPFRLHVELSRRLNRAGYPTLRFDLSTLGDSGASPAALSREQQVCNDVADAMALLRAQAGCERFVLVGLCSGAQNAHHVASQDPAVAGAVFLDGYAFRSIGFRLRHYLPRLLDPARIARHLAGRLRPRPRPPAGAGFGVEFPSRARVRDELAGMLGRGLKLCFVFSGGAHGYFNHRRQFAECFGTAIADHPGLTLHHLEASDHTYVLAGDRRELLTLIEGWLIAAFPVCRSSSHPARTAAG